MSIERIDGRWNQFLVGARERFEEVLTESINDCMQLVEADHDPRTVVRAWTAMRIRAFGFAAKVENVWDSQVREQYESRAAHERAAAAEARVVALGDWMELELRRAETGLLATLARRVLAEAEAEPHRCRSCAADLGLDHGLVLESIEPSCPRCGASNPIEPSSRARLALEFAPHLWHEACWDAWVAKHQAELLVQRAPELTLAKLKAWEQAEIEYRCAWLRERAKLLPAAVAESDLELRRHLEQFYASLEQEHVWIRAGRPRALG